MKMYKCGSSDWKMCAKNIWSPSPPAAPVSPLPPSRPTATWAPSPPPMHPSANVVACVDKAGKENFCAKKFQKNKCHQKKMQRICPLTCGAVCVTG
jgi:hypothetical protein